MYESIVGKKRDPGILDPIIFSGKIRFKVSLKFGGKIRKTTENSEKYSKKFGKNSHEKNSHEKIGYSEKYRKFGKILRKLGKILVRTFSFLFFRFH